MMSGKKRDRKFNIIFIIIIAFVGKSAPSWLKQQHNSEQWRDRQMGCEGRDFKVVM